MRTITILTDFRAAAEKIEAYVAGKNFKRKDATEPVLYSVDAGVVESTHILEVLTAGFHVERTSEDGSRVAFISDDETALKSLVVALGLKSEIKTEGRNEISEFTGPRLDIEQELIAIREMGFRVGRRPLVEQKLAD